MRPACARKKAIKMSKKLLIDARQDDETRVVLLNNNKLEDFDYETSHRKPIKGNIYLARVTRVEPSLQAAFVEYGGNRQGFLAFSEIHPDYYRIPVEDREKLLAEQSGRGDDDSEPVSEPAPDAVAAEASGEETVSGDAAETGDETPEAEAADAADGETGPDNGDENGEANGESDDTAADSSGGDDADEEVQAQRRRSVNFSRHYKIQEVIARRQIMLIQVVKEERGNKGAALTTYLSLAGRYCVLMPNTHHGGGVSRKISNPVDRKKLKSIVGSLDIPDGMAVIVRTAGSKRTKAEITRDFTYLMRQWDDIRTLTMESIAPALIHEEGNLIKRAVRDYYASDVEEIVVEGSDAYKMARSHMKNLMPSHVKKVKVHEESGQTLLQKYQVEEMLASMHEPQVTLKSGGYLVINQTEALVAIDVNSGRATRERNIEETALKTNMEAAEEIAHQLRLRDLSGLIVIDFIDMESNRNQNAVERKVKEAVKSDRARIQIGSISQFGLLEMSRQRLRSSLAETVTRICPHCEGSGRVHSIEAAALFALRAIETEAPKARGDSLTVQMHSTIAFYILNNKRSILSEIEERFSMHIIITSNDLLVAPQVRFGDVPVIPDNSESRNDNSRSRKRRSRNRPEPEAETTTEADSSSEDETTPSTPSTPSEDGSEEDKPRRRRRRGKRGGRRRRRDGTGSDTDGMQASENRDEEAQIGEAQGGEAQADASDSPSDDSDAGQAEVIKPKRSRRKAPKKAEAGEAEGAESSPAETPAGTPAEEPKAAKKAAKTRAKKKKAAAEDGDTKTAEVKTKAKAKKATAKKAKKAKAKSAATDNSSDDTKDGAEKPSREALSSAPVEVVDVDSVTPAARKKGWWSS